VPNEPWETILAVADRYGASYLVLDETRPRTTDALYAGQAEVPRVLLRYTAVKDPQHQQLYEITNPDKP
jgi:hypothetical protein